jgi:hypothetical protein
VNCIKCGKKGIRHRLGSPVRDVCRACEGAEERLEHEKHRAERHAKKERIAAEIASKPVGPDMPQARLTCRICGGYEATEALTLPNGDLGIYCKPCFDEYAETEKEWNED